MMEKDRMAYASILLPYDDVKFIHELKKKDISVKDLIESQQEEIKELRKGEKHETILNRWKR